MLIVERSERSTKMKKCLASRYIKKADLRPEENERILQDLFAFNSMKRTSFLWQRQGRKFLKEDGKELSHQLKLKDLYGCKDYFINSAIGNARALIKSGQELAKLYIDDAKEDMKAIRKALRKKKNYRKKLLKIKESIIKHTKDPKNPLKGSANIQYEKDGSVTVQFFNKVWTYETLYLFEHQWLDRKLRQLKTQIANMEHKLKRLEIKQQRLKEHPLKVRFGGKKMTKNRTIPERHRALEKRRNRRMMISGRKDCKYGNFVFHYDIETKTLEYRSMTDWSGDRICFPNVTFPYGQEWIESWLRERKGAIAWEIIDCGNAWQIRCILTKEAEDMNGYYGDGAIGIDINYDHIAMTETDQSGNLLYHKVFHYDMEGKTSGQIKHQISEAIEKAFQYADQQHKPITAENIKSIQRKKFYDKHQKKHRHISMFASACIQELLISKAVRYHIGVKFVYPAYTSKAGKMRYLRRYGLSVHEAAALCIARRGQGFKEAIPSYLKPYLKDEKVRALIPQQWGSLTKLINKVTTQDLLSYQDPVLHRN